MQLAREELIQKVEQPKKEESTTSKPYCDVVNVSEGFQLRTAYKKKVKPSKLDGLLERRVKQFTLEEKQRLERMRQAALLAKTAATKPAATVKTEGSTLGKQQPAVTPFVKEEKEESLQVNDHVVKKLDFEQEQTEMKADNLDVKPDTTAPKQTEVNAVQGNGGEAHKEVNGGSLASTELNSKNNCISDAIESKETTQMVGENGKKRGYEEIEQGSGQSDTESMEVDQSKTSPVQVNGRAGVAVPADSNVNSDQASQVQGDDKEPVKSLMNGNLLQKRKGRKGRKEKKNKRANFKFRPTVHFGLAAFPHAPDRLNPSTTPSSPAYFTEPSPSAHSKDRMTSCLPLTLSIPRPRPYLARLQTDKPMRPDANSQNT